MTYLSYIWQKLILTHRMKKVAQILGNLFELIL